MEGDAAPPGSEGGLCRRGPAVPAVAWGRGRCARRRRRLSEKTAHSEARRTDTRPRGHSLPSRPCLSSRRRTRGCRQHPKASFLTHATAPRSSSLKEREKHSSDPTRSRQGQPCPLAVRKAIKPRRPHLSTQQNLTTACYVPGTGLQEPGKKRQSKDRNTRDQVPAL